MPKTIRPRLDEKEYAKLKGLRNVNRDHINTLVVGDLHAPFIKKGYLEFCVEMYEKYDCSRVVFTGDILDNHFSGYHEIDPDGFGAAEELHRAKEQITTFYQAFPNAYVCIGNHDLIPNRKAFSSGVSKSWIRDISEILNVPNWRFSEEWVLDDVVYTHGTGRKARQRCIQERVSVVQGHYHSESYVEMYANEKDILFAMQVGCGVDRRSYAMAYGKNFKKPQINVGVVMGRTRHCIIEPMQLG